MSYGCGHGPWHYGYCHPVYPPTYPPEYPAPYEVIPPVAARRYGSRQGRRPRTEDLEDYLSDLEDELAQVREELVKIRRTGEEQGS